MKRKILSLLLVSAMALSLTISAFAAHIEPSVSADEIQAGETVDVILSINEEVSDIASLQYDVYYDAELFDYSSAARGTSNDKTVISKQKTDSAGNKYYSVLYVDTSDDGDPQTFTAGTLYTLTFTAKEDISADAAGTFTVLEKALDTSDFTSLRDKDYEGILTVTVKKAETPAAEPAAQVKSASLTLKGDIGVNYYVLPNETLRADTGAYAQFTYKGVTGDKILLSGISPQADGTYCFTQFVAAKEMTEQVVLKLFTGAGEAAALTNANGEAIADNAALYSVAKYIENAPQDAKELVEKMASYGAYAQEYFDFENIRQDEENAGAVTEKAVSETAEDLIAFKPLKEGSADGVGSLNISLTLKSLTTLNIIFTLDAGRSLDSYPVTVGGKAYTPEPVGSKYYIRIPDIAAKDLGSKYQISIGGIRLECSALSYVYNILKAYEGNPEKAGICNLVCALYEYYQAAAVYPYPQ